MTNSINSEYVHSGKLGMSVILVPLVGVVAALLLSVVYAYITVYSPVAGYISVVFTAGLVVGLGVIIARAARIAKCRNPGFVYLAGFACGLVALYASWVAFEYVLLSRFDESFDWSITNLFFSPSVVWYVATDINKTGWYSIFGVTPSGTLLWIFWAIEAVIIVAGTPFLATMEIKSEVFCEHCNRWCDGIADVVRLSPPDNKDDLVALRSGNLKSFQALQPTGRDTYPSYGIDTWKCGACNQTAAMRCRLFTLDTNEEGEPIENAEDITLILLADPADLAKITTK